MQDLIIKIMADWSVVAVVLVASWALIEGIPNSQKLQAYKRILMAGVTAYLFAKLIGSVYQPSLERPFELLGVAAGASFLNNPGFPSDHMLFVTAISLAVWFETKKKFVTILLVILLVLVGVGRVLALVHSVADILGGVMIACLGALWYLTKPRTNK
jgi:membrane-associated phospholipid phosphatase